VIGVRDGNYYMRELIFLRKRVGIFMYASVFVAYVLFTIAVRANDNDAFYFVCVPWLESDSVITSALFARDNSQSVVTGSEKSEASPADLYTIWYGDPYFQPKTATKEHPFGDSFADYAARSTLKGIDFGRTIPDGINRLLTTVQKLRDFTSKDIILQPIFADQFPALWRSVPHLHVLANSASLTPEERSQRLVRAFLNAEGKPGSFPPETADVASVLKGVLDRTGIKTHWVHYWPEYNVLVIKADSEFEGLVVAAFSLASGQREQNDRSNEQSKVEKTLHAQSFANE
jgi:hypothetical protein